MPYVIDRATGKRIFVPNDEIAGRTDIEAIEGGQLAVESDLGTRAIDASQIETARREGMPLASEGAVEEARLEERFGDSPITTALESAADTATFGAYSAIAPELGASRREMRERRERNETAGTLGAVAASFSPVGAERLITNIATKAAGRFGKGFTGTAVRGVIEGGLSATGSAVSQLALDDEPITAERAVSTLGSNFLFGAGIGGTASILGKAAGKGAAKAKGLVDEATERIGKLGEATPGSAVVDSLRTYRGAVDEVNPFIASEGSAKLVLTKAKNRLRYALDNPEGLAQYPRQALDPLQREAQALKRAIAEAPEMAAKLAKQDAKLVRELADELDTLPAGRAEVELSGKLARRYADFADVRLAKGGAVKVPLEEVAAFRQAFEAGEVAGRRAKSLNELPSLLAKNEALQKQVMEAAEAATPGFVEKGGKRLVSSLAGKVVGGAVGLVAGGGVGALVGGEVGEAIANLAFGRLGKASAEVTKRVSGALDVFMTGAKAAERVAPIAATKVLTSVAFGPETKPDRPQAPTKDKLITAYRAREAEIRAQTTLGPDMRPVMKPSARAQVAQKLGGIKALSPMLADRIETAAARKIEFLASKLPRRPDVMGLPIGPDRWTPSAFEVAKFARYVAAAEDPASIVERLNDGSMTPEDAEVLKTVYPEMFAELQMQLVMRLPELQKTLPYAKRLMLSILMGVPVDPSMRPEVLRQLQASFAQEPGTEGGTQAPTAQPQFGSIKSEQNTPAQSRAGR